MGRARYAAYCLDRLEGYTADKQSVTKAIVDSSRTRTLSTTL